MKTYLGLDHHRIGPPPNWRDYKAPLWKFWRGFDLDSYIRDVEDYIQRYHAWSFHVDITEYDRKNEEVGERALLIERLLRQTSQIVGDQARAWDMPTPPEKVAERKRDQERRYAIALMQRGLKYDPLPGFEDLIDEIFDEG